MRDVTQGVGREAAYECFDCGNVVDGTNPGTCPECGSTMRNRGTPLE
ncbi:MULTISPECIES: rubrerythrin-like domain-containing protein [Haloferacaceae]|uniref:Rubrerythrin-like domain-containing protein n=1 Tax=Halorubrum glutamatedens TaxID=2707018 RepID=A0ABD5QSC6_9EURY|nr:rubrerythrin-like domain-containing protein [Halobellus captivus]